MKILLAIALASIATAQSLIPTTASSTFPQCALGCSTLYEAQSGCVPPAAPVSNEQTYVSCFCQSGLLTALHSSPDVICTDYCTVESDRQLLMQWYNNFCNSGGAGAVPAATTTFITSAVVPSSVTVLTITSTASSPSTSTSTNTSTSSSSSSSSNDSWINTHWKWVVMLAFLVVGLGALAYFAVWLKRRHRRKVDEKRAMRSGFAIDREKAGSKAGSRASTGNLEELFGPAQHMANTRGWEYPNDPDQIMAAGGVLAGEKKKSQRKVRRHHSSRGTDSDRIGAAEVGEEVNRSTSERGSKSRRKRDRENEREKNKEIERGLRGIKGKDVERDKH